MITAAETKQRFEADSTSWKIALMDFVDDFRYHNNADAISEPFDLSDEQKDAVLAGVIETLCDELQIPIPDWLFEIPACQSPYFLSQMENLKAFSIVQTPPRLRLRKVFVMENFLHRV